MNKEIKKKIAKNWFKTLQNVICFEIEKLENSSAKFVCKKWVKKKRKKNEGGGEYRILQNGKIFEKVGVNFSEVSGKFSKDIRKKIPGTKKNGNFWASGISIVMHMENPHVPAMHFNTAPTVKFVGGSTDITGPVEVGAASVPNFVLPYSPVGWCETGDNEALKITSTTEGFQGVVVYQEIA